MRRRLLLVGILAALGCAHGAEAQTAQQPRPRYVGSQTGGSTAFNTAARRATETFTLKFDGPDGASAFTVDFVAQYPIAIDRGGAPAAAPSIVDMVITEHAPDESNPAVSVVVDNEPMDVVMRPRQSRSAVSSMPFTEFLKLARADAVMERAFGAELVFGNGQLRMLRATADRWSAIR